MRTWQEFEQQFLPTCKREAYRTFTKIRGHHAIMGLEDLEQEALLGLERVYNHQKDYEHLSDVDFDKVIVSSIRNRLTNILGKVFRKPAFSSIALSESGEDTGMSFLENVAETVSRWVPSYEDLHITGPLSDDAKRVFDTIFNPPDDFLSLIEEKEKSSSPHKNSFLSLLFRYLGYCQHKATKVKKEIRLYCSIQ